MGFGTSDASGSLDLIEIWRMGDSEEDAVLFRSIDRIAVDSRGQVYVAEWYHPAIRVFSNSGEFLREIGREGSGPGEFGNPTDVVVGMDDSLFVWDKASSMRRVSVFSPHDYDLVTTIIVRDELPLDYPDRLIGAVPEGYLLSFRTTFFEDEREGMKLDSPRFIDVYLVNRQDGTLKRRLAHIPDRQMVATRSRGSKGVFIMPFTRMPRVTMNSGGLLYSAYSDSIAITVRSANGQEQRVIRWTHEPVPLTSREVNDYFSGRTRAYRRAAEDAGIPSTKPAFQNYVVDDRDRVWVQLSAPYESRSASYVILDASGNQLGRTELPAHLRLEVIRGDRAYGVLEPNEGAPVLVSYLIK